MKLQEIRKISLRTIEEFESRKILDKNLAKLYKEYCPIPNMGLFIYRSKKLFPALNCGLASLYLRKKLREGEIVQGSYRNRNHTFLLIKEKTIVDITSDQYGGPQVFVGPLKEPWRKASNRNILNPLFNLLYSILC